MEQHMTAVTPETLSEQTAESRRGTLFRRLTSLLAGFGRRTERI
jgi:hypothetical protein